MSLVGKTIEVVVDNGLSKFGFDPQERVLRGEVLDIIHAGDMGCLLIYDFGDVHTVDLSCAVSIKIVEKQPF